jgi:hypothetical protein
MYVEQPQKISVGDTVTIEACGMTRTGEVLYVCWDGYKNNWLIDAKDSRGFFNWRQSCDGGRLVEVKRKTT